VREGKDLPFHRTGGQTMKTKCQIWSRVVGYLRPVDKWNDGKQAEFKDRKEFKAVQKQ